MRYMLMIKGDAANHQALRTFNQALIDAKVWLGAEGLGAQREACTVRRANGEAEAIESAFSNIAAFWHIRVESRAEALQWADRAPVALGHVELRRLYETEDFPVDAAEEQGGWREKELAFRDEAPAVPAAKQPRFILLLQSDALAESGALPTQEVLEQMSALMGELVNKGQLLGGEGLKPSADGIRVYFEGKRRRVMDGPFTETKELVAGYTLICAPMRDEAIIFAKRWLEVHAGMRGVDQPSTIEIRTLSEEFAGRT